MNEIVLENLLFILSIMLFIAIYITTSMAMFKISKNESISKPWFAWIPIFNDYLLIKLGKGSNMFMILAILGFVVDNPYMQLSMQGQGVKFIITILTGAWSLYKIYLYNKICNRYDISIMLLAIGLLFQLVPQFYIVGMIITLIGQAQLYVKAKKGVINKTIIESKVIFSRKKNKNIKNTN